MSRYTTKLQNIQEANIRLEKRLLREQQEVTDTPLPGCLKKILDVPTHNGSESADYPMCKVISDTIEKGGTVTTQMKTNCAKDLGLQANDKFTNFPKIDELIKCITNSVKSAESSSPVDDEKG